MDHQWAEQIRSYVVVEEYMENGRVSVGVPMILMHACFWVIYPISEETIERLMETPSIVRQSAIICRLADDLGTASVELERGDVAKSIQCYMHEAGVSEEEARKHIKHLIAENWKQMNEDRLNSPFCRVYNDMFVNAVRMAQSMYQYGDGHGAKQDVYTKDKVLSIFVNPIPYPHENRQD